MNLETALFLVLAAITCGVFYYAYWLAWVWMWTTMWPTGPRWLVQPALVNFIIVSFTMVIFTVILLKGSK